MNWDLVWSGNDASSLPMNWQELKPHQRINRFPGSNCLTSKTSLTTEVPSENIPPGFQTVEDLRDFVNDFPDTRFVITSNGNKAIKSGSEINVQDHDGGEFFAQEYVEDPLLMDFYKFELSAFAVITSVYPLRIYLNTKEIVLRFCSEHYEDIDVVNLDKHFIGKSQKTAFEFSATKPYTNFNYTAKQAFIAVNQQHGLDYVQIFRDLEFIVWKTVADREHFFIDEVRHV